MCWGKVRDVGRIEEEYYSSCSVSDLGMRLGIRIGRKENVAKFFN